MRQGVRDLGRGSQPRDPAGTGGGWLPHAGQSPVDLGLSSRGSFPLSGAASDAARRGVSLGSWGRSRAPGGGGLRRQGCPRKKPS
jgi:hypothetical protein